MSKNVSRRGLFSIFARPLRSNTATTAAASPSSQNPPDPTRVAVIQGRFCLAYTSVCSVCSERCPVPGAITVTRGLPMVVSEICTGCGVCHDVCPAPRNAVLVLPRKNPTHVR